MFGIELVTSYRPRSGNIVNWALGVPEIFNVRMEITNQHFWELQKCEYHLLSISGNAKLVGEDPLPAIIKGEDIPGQGGTRAKEFVLESTGTGDVNIELEFKWNLAGTTLTFPVKDTVSLNIAPS